MGWSVPAYNQAQALKVHRLTQLAFTEASTWTDVPFEERVTSESTPDFDFLSSDALSIIKSHTSGIFWVGGCIHPKLTALAPAAPTLAIRVVTSENGTDWTEHRCLQFETQKSRNNAEFDTAQYYGSITTSTDTQIKLQVRTSDTTLVLLGDSDVFDNPISATMTIYGGQIES